MQILDNLLFTWIDDTRNILSSRNTLFSYSVALPTHWDIQVVHEFTIYHELWRLPIWRSSNSSTHTLVSQLQAQHSCTPTHDPMWTVSTYFGAELLGIARLQRTMERVAAIAGRDLHRYKITDEVTSIWLFPRGNDLSFVNSVEWTTIQLQHLQLAWLSSCSFNLFIALHWPVMTTTTTWRLLFRVPVSYVNVRKSRRLDWHET